MNNKLNSLGLGIALGCVFGVAVAQHQSITQRNEIIKLDKDTISTQGDTIKTLQSHIDDDQKFLNQAHQDFDTLYKMCGPH